MFIEFLLVLLLVVVLYSKNNILHKMGKFSFREMWSWLTCYFTWTICKCSL